MNPEDRQALLEQENRERTERLAAKVAALKNFTMDIEYEARDQRLLDDMSSGFESTFSFLTSGSNRINRLLLSGRGNRKLCCYMSLAITTFLFIFYFMIHSALYSSSSSSSQHPPVANIATSHVIAPEQSSML